MASPPTPPTCEGCVTPAERALWQQLADEIDAYFNPPLQVASLF